MVSSFWWLISGIKHGQYIKINRYWLMGLFIELADEHWIVREAVVRLAA
jgi:hypothetical protein